MVAEKAILCYDLSMTNAVAETEMSSVNPPESKPVTLLPEVTGSGVKAIQPDKHMNEIIDAHPEESVMPAAQSVPTPTALSETLMVPITQTTEVLSPDRKSDATQTSRYAKFVNMLNKIRSGIRAGKGGQNGIR